VTTSQQKAASTHHLSPVIWICMNQLGCGACHDLVEFGRHRSVEATGANIAAMPGPCGADDGIEI
jgi:hypothetical protein